MISSLLHLVGLRPRVYYTLTNFRGGGGPRPPWPPPPPQYANEQYILNTKMKVATRNNLLKKLANSKWGTNARTIRTTALALCYSTAEYAAPVWARSSHANKLNPVLNQSCRSITGCL